MTGFRRRATMLGAASLLAALPVTGTLAGARRRARGPGVVLWRSGLDFGDTVEHLQKDVLAKGIRLFDVIDQTKLAAGAGIALHQSTLLIFGNPPLGIQFLTANPLAGLDWPVRLLVSEDESKTVWLACNDFDWIARRHGITDRKAALNMATSVVASIVAAVHAVPA